MLFLSLHILCLSADRGGRTLQYVFQNQVPGCYIFSQDAPMNGLTCEMVLCKGNIVASRGKAVNHGWDWAPNLGYFSEFGLNGENTQKMLRQFGLRSMITTMGANKGEYVIRSQTLPPCPNIIVSVGLRRAVSELQRRAAASAERCGRCVSQTSKIFRSKSTEVHRLPSYFLNIEGKKQSVFTVFR